MASIWQPMRCRTLAQPDKKQISVVRTMIDLLAVEATIKTNDLDTLFSRLRSLASTIVPCPAAEEGAEAPLYPLSQADIDSLQEAINHQEKQHREDEYKDFFDEAKLRPLAHKCMVLWNKVEGFESAPFEDVSEADRIKKRARFEATVVKRRDVEEKKRVAMAQKEEDAVRREEFKKAIAAPVQAGIMTVEDSTIPDAPPLGFVDYTNIPLVGLDEAEEEEDASPPTALTYYHDFERALEVWSFLVSVPEPIKLSQFSFSSFVTALTTPNETHLIESIFSALVQTGVRGSPNIPSPKQVEQQMRGNPWFKRALQFFDIASGKKQERERQQKAKALAKKRQREEIEEVDDDSDEDEEESDDAESDESEDDDDESSSVAVEVEEDEEVRKDEEGPKAAEVVEVEEEPTIAGFDAELKALHDELQRLGRLALWVNLSISERLVFLKFLVECLLEAPAVVAAAEKVDKETHAQVLAFEKRVKELRDETDKKLKKLVKTILTATPQAGTPNTAEEPTETRESVVAALKEDIRKELVKMVKKSESGEIGAKIVPLGQDRYRRLYWRFPLDSGVYVQTTAETRPFVLAPRPAKAAMLLDDEDEDPKKAKGETEEEKPQFQVWGRICAEHLPAFLATLDKRGTREAHLKAQLEPLVSHLSQLAAPPTPSVVTRSRAVYGGYRNSFMEI